MLKKSSSFYQRLFLFTLLLVFCLISGGLSRINQYHVKQFFKLTYDQNNDQIITFSEFYKYFRQMEPDQQINFFDLNHAFNLFDFDKNGLIHLSEFIKFPDALQPIQKMIVNGHRQIHIGFTQNQNQMQVMWVSNFVTYDQPVVIFGMFETDLNLTSKASTTSYNVGHLGFHGQIYRAVMKGLQPGHRYYYKVGDKKSNTYSELKYFKAPPKKNQTLNQVRIAVFGDMGTFTPLGYMVTKLLASKNTAKPYDFVFLTGDIAYAGVSKQTVGQLQPVWDLFGQQSQMFAAYTPFMPGVGNHQRFYNYTSYMKRYRLPRNTTNQTNLWFSFDYGQVHMIHLSSQHPYQMGSQQYIFLQQDLKKARANPHIKWIFVATHRAFYCSDSMEYAPQTPLLHHLQELVNKYKVDIVQTGHIHVYQRTWPVYKGKAHKQNHDQKYYVNPDTPIYVVQGTSGALITTGKKDHWISPTPEWSLRRIRKYGYGQVTIKANYLKYEFISLPVGKVVDTWYIIKDSKQNKSRIISQINEIQELQKEINMNEQLQK